MDAVTILVTSQHQLSPAVLSLPNLSLVRFRVCFMFDKAGTENVKRQVLAL